MNGLNFVKSVRERIVPLLCLALFVSAGTSLVSRSEAQATASGTASLNFNLTTDQYVAGTATYEDDDGNYNSVGLQPNFFVNAQVVLGGTTTEEEGTVIISQPFIAVPFTGPAPTLTFNSVMTAVASTQDASQSASAVSGDFYSSITMTCLNTSSASVPVGGAATDAPIPLIDVVSVSGSVAAAGYTAVGMVQADAANH